ncbi:MAG: DNA replication/repair protein RecF [Pseudomonadota bacterium]
MTISRLEISHFRNLQPLILDPSEKINIIFGDNGAGKTSLLEAIYYLGMGRSFRTHHSKNIIQTGQDKFLIFIKKDHYTIGMERCRDGRLVFKVADDDVDSISQLAKLLPLQLINPDVYQLLNEGPKFRREFIDWGVFHVEHPFFSTWKEFHRIIKHRNLAIKMRAPKDEIQSWDQGLAKASENLSVMRSHYIQEFKPYLLSILDKIIKIDDLSISYNRGWPKDKAYLDQLEQAYLQDCDYGFTRYGPHRADLTITINGYPAKDMLSRGQQKLFVYAMRLAQGLLLKEKSDINCTYLIDDLPAELDESKRKALFTILLAMEAQIFISSIDLSSVNGLINATDNKVFHVEHGTVTEKN